MAKTLDVLRACMPRCKQPEAWAAAFDAAFENAPPKDLAMFFAQVGHESSDLQALEEGLSYSSADRIKAVFGRSVRGLSGDAIAKLVRNPQGLANAVYALRGGNGNTLSGDGWAFRGRGPIQISMRDNYAALQADTGMPALKNPDLLLADKTAGARSAVWFWRKNVEDGASIEKVTRQINGPAMAGLLDRKLRYERGLA